MKNLKKTLSLLLILLLSLSLVSCDPTLPKDVQSKFDTFLSDEFKEYITSDTITLHYNLKDPSSYDIKNFDPTLGEFSIDALKKDSKDTIATLKKLKSFDYYSLTEDQQLTYDILKNYLETEAESSDFTYYYNILSPTIGLQANLPITLAEYKFYDKSDVEDYISLIKLIDEYFNNVINYEKLKSEKGLFMADFAVDDIINQCNDFMSVKDDNYLITTFNNKINSLTDISDEEKKKYIAENKDSVLNVVLPAYENLVNELTKLKGTGTNEGGLCNLPLGKDYYEYLIKSYTGSDKSINKMKKMLETRLDNLFIELNSIISNSPEVLDVFGKQTNELTDPTEILSYLKDNITKDYPSAPETSYEIRYVDPSLEENLSPAFYMVPPIDDYKSNVVYINNKLVDQTTLFPTLAHEGYPGHLYQTTYFNSTNPNPIRNILNFSGYTEGWATYVELHSYELANLNNDALVKLSQIHSEITLAIPTIIDIGVNYEGWSLKDTEDFLTNYGYEASIAEDIYKSVIEEPANYPKYYIGYLEFNQLQNYCENKLGNKFNLKDFNKTLLDVGPAPFSIIKDEIDDYIKETKN